MKPENTFTMTLSPLVIYCLFPKILMYFFIPIISRELSQGPCVIQWHNSSIGDHAALFLSIYIMLCKLFTWIILLIVIKYIVLLCC